MKPPAKPKPEAEVLAGARRWHLAHADALRWLERLPDACVDAVITDPPYSSGGQFRGDRAKATGKKYLTGRSKKTHPDFEGDTRDQLGWQHWCHLWLSACYRVTKPGGLLVSFTDWRQVTPLNLSIQSAGWLVRGLITWDKTEGCRPSMGRFAQQGEFCWWASHGALAERAELGRISGVFRHSAEPMAKRNHQVAKPLPLLLDLVRVVAPGGLVLDPFGGGGTTAVAALRTGRRFLGCEMAEGCHTQAVARLEAEDHQLDQDAAERGQLSLLEDSSCN